MEAMAEAVDLALTEPPRIAKLRSTMVAIIPCESKHESVARSELNSLPFYQLHVQYLNWAHRFVPRIPRKV